MKITVHNLGVLKEAEVDLKPLTVFVGPNNAGKTWLAYTIASIFSSYGFSKYMEKYLHAYEENAPGLYPLLENAIEQVSKSGTASIDVVQLVREYGELYFNNVAHVIQQWMPQFMGTQLASFEHLDISVNVGEAKTYLAQQVLNVFVRSEIPAGKQQPLLSMRKKQGDRKLYIYTSVEYAVREVETEKVLPFDIIKEFMVRTILQILHRSLYHDVCILPTERTTFITFPFSKRKEVADIPINQPSKLAGGPVSYFLHMIGATFEHSLEDAKQRDENAKNNPRIKKYRQLADLLEQQILGGEVKIPPQDANPLQNSESDAGREILFQPTKESQLEISIASSMVKELSPLVLYLRYLAEPLELLIIDEPEMNLHPEAQVKMMEFLVMLINADLNVLVTTHSPYIIDHLTNLIKAAEVSDKDSIRDEFYLKQTEAFISRDKVSVYMVDATGTTKAMDEDGTINLHTFGEVSDRISEIYFKL
ncbi:MAG TPA: AAA family ATPase [Ktedonobacteraceae bacterium]|nr:AAA family ATPase [Ktedonobacteraceae bacterium]